MKEKRKSEIKQILKSKKGHYNNGRLKKGAKWLANKYNVSEELIFEINEELKSEFRKERLNEIPDKFIKIIRENNKAYAQAKVSNKPPNILNNKINEPGTYWITGCVHAPFHNKAMYESTFDF